MNKNRQIKKICAISLTAATSIGLGIGTLHYNVHNAPNSEVTVSTKTLRAASDTSNNTTKKTSSSANGLFKDEIVYALADQHGSVNDITVADWLKNISGTTSVNDQSFLTNITNTKGNETFQQSSDNTLTWKTGNNDIYYQGKTSENLPVGVQFTYKLDGQEIEPSELAGKSGKVEINIQYTNNTKETIKIGNENANLSIPFLMTSAIILSNDNFTNVTIDNGKLISDGNRTIAIGIGMPGLKDSLDMKEDFALDITDSVTITADTENFQLDSSATYASADLLNNIDLDDNKTINDLEKDLDELTDASKKLKDGARDLADGLNTLKSKTGDFSNGVNTLASSLITLTDSVNALSDGTTTYVNGVNTLANGIVNYTNGTDTLATGITEYTKGTTDYVAGVNTLTSSLSNMPSQLSQLSDGYAQVMGGFQQLADNTDAIKDGAAGVSSGITSINSGLANVQSGVTTLNNALTELEASYTSNEALITSMTSLAQTMDNAEAKQKMITSIESLKKVTATQKATINQLKISTASDQTMAMGINALVTTTGTNGKLKTGADALASGADKFASGASQIKNSLPALQKGTNTFVNAATALPDGLKELTAGGTLLTTKAELLNAGANQLLSNSPALNSGGSKLLKNSDTLLDNFKKLTTACGQLKDGGNDLNTATDKLSSGIDDLYDGSITLSDGMNDFDKDGIQKINDMYQNDIQTLIDRAKALKDLGSDYQSFSGLNQSMNGSVKFIIKTEEIKTEEE